MIDAGECVPIGIDGYFSDEQRPVQDILMLAHGADAVQCDDEVTSGESSLPEAAVALRIFERGAVAVLVVVVVVVLLGEKEVRAGKEE